VRRSPPVRTPSPPPVARTSVVRRSPPPPVPEVSEEYEEVLDF
jgi:hypothetical protein